MRAPPLPGLEPEILGQRLIDALRDVRFEPAQLDGEPVAVYYSLSLELRADP